MITLEANKVYKIVHSKKFFCNDFPRDYIICCPEKDYIIDDSRLVKTSRHLKLIQYLNCVFSINFFGIPLVHSSTSVLIDCHFEPLNVNDINDIKKILDSGYLKGFKYNRKLNQLIKNDDFKG